MSVDDRGAAPPPRAAQEFPPGASKLTVLGILAALLIVSFLSVLPTFRTQPAGTVVAGATPAPGTGGQPGGGPGPGGGPVAGPSGGAAPNGGPAGGGGPGGPGHSSGATACAPGHNGGATDTGVTATSIKLASTVAESGIGQSFLGDVRYGMTAVVNQTNAAGGICGRKLDLTLVDDGWSPTLGESDIRSFIADGVFALPVVPSSEGLNQASRSQDIDNATIPVIGTDGMLYSQYADPWIWPVATSTISTAHIAVKSAYDSGARTFGIVYDTSYKFGSEGEKAFKGAISRLSGARLLADVGVEAGDSDYSTPGKDLNDGCGKRSDGSSGCDMIFVLLEPSTAETWFATSSMHPGNRFTEGPQPLFVDTFGQNCGDPCNNMIVWTSYYPDRDPFASTPAVTRYVNAIRSVSASADVDNQFLEGGYDGMLLFVQALRQVGPDLTRHAMRQALDTMRFDSGLSQPISWSSGSHFANTAMLGFSIQYSQGFNGFQYLRTGWVTDPWVGQDKP